MLAKALSYDALLVAAKRSVPSLKPSMYKGAIARLFVLLYRGAYYLGCEGQCGRVGVVGGCLEFTGAPYFATMSALYSVCLNSVVFGNFRGLIWYCPTREPISVLSFALLVQPFP